MKKPAAYDVVLRRDVQQVTRVRVEASSPQEAIDVAAELGDVTEWKIEEHIGTHKPEVHKAGR